jgi:molecular chaperone HtpG
MSSLKTLKEDKVLYFEKGKSDHALRKELLSVGLQAIETESYIDPHFTQHVEMTKLGDNTYHFASVDSEIAGLLEQEATTDSDIKVKDMFTNILIGNTEHGAHSEAEEDMDSLNHGGLKDIEIVKIKNSTSPAYFKVDEQMKRMHQMAKSMGNDAMFPIKKTLVINPGSPIIQNALKLHEKGNDALVKKICHHVEDLALISSEGLKHEDREAFVNRTQELMQELTNLAL